jgi:predicted amidophosphoribosyltransferase
VLDGLLELLFPSRCFGCRELGPEICNRCRSNWNPHIYIKKLAGLNIYSAIDYNETAKSILLGAKEGSIKTADYLIVRALQHCLDRAPGISIRELTFVPIPSTKKAIRRRGRNFLLEITERFALPYRANVIDALEINRKIFDQTKLDAINRRKNLFNAYACNLPGDEIRKLSNVILVDDLVTTGSTINEAHRALSAVGIHVTCAITACVAKPLR